MEYLATFKSQAGVRAEIASDIGRVVRPASDGTRDIGAKWRFLEGRVRRHALFQVYDVPMANLLRGDRESGGAEVLL